MNGKGDSRRPTLVDRDIFAANWDAAFGRGSMKASKVNHAECLRLVKEIDEQGTRLSRDQINFIAGIIDSKQTEFSEVEESRIEKIYDKKVVNGLPENDD